MYGISFKTVKVLIGGQVEAGAFAKAWHPQMPPVLNWIMIRYNYVPIVVTSAVRKCLVHPSDSGIHLFPATLRALDIRSYTFELPEKVADDINAHWSYDPQRPHLKVCVYHDTGKGHHFHLQVHDNTIHLGG